MHDLLAMSVQNRHPVQGAIPRCPLLANKRVSTHNAPPWS
jgi:hypothetical protein